MSNIFSINCLDNNLCLPYIYPALTFVAPATNRPPPVPALPDGPTPPLMSRECIAVEEVRRPSNGRCRSPKVESNPDDQPQPSPVLATHCRLHLRRPDYVW